MKPVLRISGHRSFTVTLDGAGPEQLRALQELADASIGGTDRISAPLSFSGPSASPVAVLSGPADELKRMLRTAFPRYPALHAAAEDIGNLLDRCLETGHAVSCRDTLLEFGTRTWIMGILNATPDSFSDGGLYADPGTALKHARDMVASGADILDIGGESTRPGAEPVSEEEELRRIIPLIERISAEVPAPISVDTYKSSVAKKALAAGASLINDISGLRFSPDMAKVVADSGAAVVIMHSKGTPRDMQQNPVYDDVVQEILNFLEDGIVIAEKAGVDRRHVLIDPGIGFGKTLEHNLEIIDRLSEFRCLGRPIVLGTSRKKFIGTVLDLPRADERVYGTAATVSIGIERGADMVRVHDVGRMAQVARMTDAIVRRKR